MPTQTVNGASLYFEESGNPAGAPILMHHGYTGSHDAWSDLIAPRLAGRYRCVVMDARGAGDSEHTAGGYSLEQYAADVVGMADALGLARFTYVGHSMGGGIGFRLALDHADRLDRLVLVAPIPSGGVRTDPAARAEAVAVRAAPDGRERMLRDRLAMRVRATPEQVERGLDRALSVSAGHYEDSWRAMVDLSVTDRLGEITTPTLMIAGAADGLCADNVQDWLCLPNATLHVFSRTGHSIPSDVPDGLAEAIADFMEHGVVNARTLQDRVRQAATAARGG